MNNVFYHFILIFVLFLGSTSISRCQTVKPLTYLEVDRMPIFLGKEGSVDSFIQKNIVWPKIFDGTGSVFFSFIITKNGNVENVKIIKGLCIECDKEVTRLLLSMPRWKPAKFKGKEVDVMMYYAVIFKLG